MALARSALNIRLDPTPEQADALEGFAGARRWVWNWALQRRKETYEADGKAISWSELSKELTALKREPETEWLSKADSQALQQAMHDVKAAFAAFFRGDSGYPRWRSRKRHTPTFRIPQRVRLDGSTIYVPKIGHVKVRHIPPGPDGCTKGATFKRSAAGHWYAKLVVEWHCEEGPVNLPADPDQVVGVDLGLTTYAVLSDGTKVANPRFGREGDRKLRELHRDLSRKKRGSRNRAKARTKLARAYEKIENQRNGFTHKLTTGLLDRFEGVCIENLGVSALTRTKLARSVLDAAWGEIKRQLAYKAPRRGKYLGYAGRFEATTKVCHVCYHRAPRMSLSDRSWRCGECGIHHDRDENAAAMVKHLGWGRYAPGTMDVAAGLVETQNARGPTVRPATAGSLG
jgi:putative transposase